MAIVRGEKRQLAIDLLTELRAQIDTALRTLDAVQASCETLELELGLGSEGEQSLRSQCIVMHFSEGNDKGHPLDECTGECEAEEVLKELGETEKKEPERETDDRDED